jgi:hypothetical protein
LAGGGVARAATQTNFASFLQKLIAPDTRNAMAMAISVALNAPIDRPHYGVFRM